MAATPSSRCSRSPCSLIYSTHIVPDAAANKASPEPGPCSSLCCPGARGCSAALSVPHSLPDQEHAGFPLYIPNYSSERMGDGDSLAGNPPPNTRLLSELRT